VKFNQYHSAAGYYVVIDGYKSSYDYVYMHLQERSPFHTGDRVKTGQMIGRVGDSGNASGCHLHYEMWSAPGWYDGGDPTDPLRFLKAWDSWS
jgi:murein DD-endopeptidase MepM/ murein hydrolase activator NlpD